MDVVILAGGKGTRLAPHTNEKPKPLVRVAGKPILAHVLSSLPQSITRALVITEFEQEQVQTFCAEYPSDIPIICIPQIEMRGTYGALKSAETLVSDSFLVINGDDIHTAGDLTTMFTHERSFGVSKRVKPGYHAILKNQTGMLAGMRPQTSDELSLGTNIATGAYVLDMDFFELPPQQLKNGEYGIPHTLVIASDAYPVTVIDMPHWISINTPDDLIAGERELLSRTT